MDFPMLSSLGSTTSFSASGAPAISPTDLYARVSNSLLSKNPAVKEVNASRSQDQTQLSGLGQLQSALSSFQSVTQALAGTGLETGGTSSSPTVLTALTNSNAAKGSYA